MSGNLVQDTIAALLQSIYSNQTIGPHRPVLGTPLISFRCCAKIIARKCCRSTDRCSFPDGGNRSGGLLRSLGVGSYWTKCNTVYLTRLRSRCHWFQADAGSCKFRLTRKARLFFDKLFEGRTSRVNHVHPSHDG